MSERTWIKDKYTARKVMGRYSSTHNDSAKKTKKYSGGRTTVVYNPKEHVLVLTGTGKRTFLHHEDARRVLPSDVQL